jgi:hypothetical protein
MWLRPGAPWMHTPLALGVCLLAFAPASRGILFKATGDPAYNTSAPTGALAGSGWQYQGQWAGFLGTPIAPRFFIAATHVNGGNTNVTFDWNGFSYHPVAFSNCPSADLTVWQVAETFPDYARLYTAADEVGRHVVVFGRGTRRGEPVVLNGLTNGWQWGPGDGVERWGENDVASIAELGPGLGETLRATFDRNGGSNECHLSVGDSSGAMFILEGGLWKLAGIHYAVDGPFSTNADGSGPFNAALLQMQGLYVDEGTSWTLQVRPAPSAFYSTRISANVTWINRVIDFRPGPDLQMTAVRRNGADLLIDLATGSNRLYRVDCATNLNAPVWSTLTNNVAGTGGIVTVTDPNALSERRNRYYRAVLLR